MPMNDQGWTHAARRVLSIYDDAPFRRTGMYVAYGASLALLVAGSAAALAPLLLLVWANATRLVATLAQLLDRHPWLLVAVPALAMAARIVMNPPTASDDLLRHIASDLWPGRYADMYVHAELPPGELYPTFDRALGWLARGLGAQPAMWIAQGAAFAGFVVAVAGASLARAPRGPWRWYWTAIGVGVLTSLTAFRLSLARPEIFMTIWAISAVAIRTRAVSWGWCAAGLALGSGYWLAPIYFPVALLLPGSGRFRLTVAAVLVAGWVLIWWAMCGPALVPTLTWTFEAVASRIPGTVVGENSSILGALTIPYVLLLVLGAAWATTRPSSDRRLLLIALWFAMSNQIRYLSVVAPILWLYLTSASPTTRANLPAGLKSACACLVLVLGIDAARGLPDADALPIFPLAAGSIVLAENLPVANAMLFNNPGGIRVAPAFEIGAASAEVQRIVQDIAKGRLDCGAVLPLGFTHIVERSLKGPPPACISLERIQAGWRLWSLTPPAKRPGLAG